MSPKLSSSFLPKCLHAFNENCIFARVTLLPLLASCSLPNSIFLVVFLSSCIMKLFKPSTPKVYIRQKQICPWFNVQYTPSVHAWLVRAGFKPCIGYDERIFALFSRHHRLVVNKSIQMICSKTPTKLPSISGSLISIKAVSI